VNQALLLLAFYPEEELESQGHDDLSGRLRLAIMLYPSLLDLFDFDKVRENWTFCQGDQSASRSGGMSNLLFTCLLLWSDQCTLCCDRQLLFLFTPEQQGDFICRVGRLNVLNTLRCDGGVQFCLER
jgi:hypothetical protein